MSIKHFGLNNCDTQRGTIATWASEQTIRQIHTKAYEIAVKEGNTTAIMSATNYVGNWSAATCYPLLTTLLRDEWGFIGFVLTDMTIRDATLSVKAGNDLQLQGTPNIAPTDGDNLTSSLLHALRVSTKRIMYVYCNTIIMNGWGGEELSNYNYTGVTKLTAVQSASTEINLAENSISLNYQNTMYNDLE